MDLDGRRQRPRPRHRQPADALDLDRLTAAVRAIVSEQGLLDQLEALLGHPASQPNVGTIGRHAPGSSEPWHGEAAAAYWEIHFGVRQLEDDLRRIRGLGRRHPPRGGTRGNTVTALGAVADLATGAPAAMVTRAADLVERWATRARRLREIDESEPWAPIPRVAGAPPPACPYCTNLSLRMKLGREIVRCFTPGCRDLDDKIPQARMERGRMSGDGLLVFGDSTVVSYRDTHAHTDGDQPPPASGE